MIHNPQSIIHNSQALLSGKACSTSFKVLQRGVLALEGAYKGVPAAKVEVTPITGRRHQIRVHLMHSGFPIVVGRCMLNP